MSLFCALSTQCSKELISTALCKSGWSLAELNGPNCMIGEERYKYLFRVWLRIVRYIRSFWPYQKTETDTYIKFPCDIPILRFLVILPAKYPAAILVSFTHLNQINFSLNIYRQAQKMKPYASSIHLYTFVQPIILKAHFSREK